MNEINPQECFIIHPDVMYTFIDHEAIMLKSDEEGLFGLNEIAAEILMQLQATPSSVKNLTDYIFLHYDVDKEQCQKDMHYFLKALLEKQLIIHETP